MVGRYTHRPSQRRSPPAPQLSQSRDGDRINAVLAAGYNFSLLRRWFEEFLRALLLLTLRRAFRCASHRNVLHGRRSTRVMVAAQP
jgi:hypothetical protein